VQARDEVKRSSIARERIDDQRQMKISSVRVWNICRGDKGDISGALDRARAGEKEHVRRSARTYLRANVPDPDWRSEVLNLEEGTSARRPREEPAGRAYVKGDEDVYNRKRAHANRKQRRAADDANHSRLLLLQSDVRGDSKRAPVQHEVAGSEEERAEGVVKDEGFESSCLGLLLRRGLSDGEGILVV
jgi:hypothetical protein